MLFIAVTMVLCGPGVKDPPEFRPCRGAAGSVAAAVIPVPAIFSFWNDSIQMEASSFYTAASFLWKRISNKSSIAHCSPRLNGCSIQLAAGIEMAGITAYTVDFQGKPIVEMPRFGNTGDSNACISAFI